MSRNYHRERASDMPLTEDEIKAIVREAIKQESRGMIVAPTNGARLKFYGAIAGLLLTCASLGGVVVSVVVQPYLSTQISARIRVHEEEAQKRMVGVAAGYATKTEIEVLRGQLSERVALNTARFDEILRRLDSIEKKVEVKGR